MESPFRDTFKIYAYRFGQGEKTLAIVGSMRGDEVQQQFICSQIIRHLTKLEEKGKLTPGFEIVVIPCVNPFSMNIEKRFWTMDNTDINRMFPGYNKGETTQRIAAKLFETIQGYKYGLHLSSYYMPGSFTPHVRIIETGYEDIETARLFGLPYIFLRKPLPFDTTLLNYNWQIWETKAFTLYAGENYKVGGDDCTKMLEAISRFIQQIGVAKHSHTSHMGYNSSVINDNELVVIKSSEAGIFYPNKKSGDKVKEGEVLAKVIDPSLGNVISEIISTTDGVIFFSHIKPLVLQNATAFTIIPE